MRNALLILPALLALALPAAGLGGSSAKGDGTLSVRDGNAVLTLSARGVVFGRIQQGAIKIVDYAPDDDNVFEDFGTCARTKDLSDTTTICSGPDIRFRFAAGRFDIRITGRGINVTAVGKGLGTVAGKGTLDDGTYSLNGGAYFAIPFLQKSLTLQAPPTGA